MKLAAAQSLPVSNLKDVVAMLRRTADKMESGELATPDMLTLVASMDGKVTVFGFGDSTSTAEVVGLLHMAAMKMALE